MKKIVRIKVLCFKMSHVESVFLFALGVGGVGASINAVERVRFLWLYRRLTIHGYFI